MAMAVQSLRLRSVNGDGNSTFYSESVLTLDSSKRIDAEHFPYEDHIGDGSYSTDAIDNTGEGVLPWTKGGSALRTRKWALVSTESFNVESTLKKPTPRDENEEEDEEEEEVDELPALNFNSKSASILDVNTAGLSKAAILKLAAPTFFVVSIEKRIDSGYWSSDRFVAVKVQSKTNWRTYPAILEVFVHNDLKKSEIKNRVAAASFLRQHKLPIPKVYAYDIGNDNAIDSPYILHEQVSGVSLSKVIKDLSYSQQLDLIGDYVGLLSKILGTKVDKSGIVRCGEDKLGRNMRRRSTMTDGFHDEGPNLLADRAKIQGYGVFPFGTEQKATKPQKNFRNLIFEQLSAWKKLDKNYLIGVYEKPAQAQLHGAYGELLDLALEMQQVGYFPSSDLPIVLQPGDIGPYNIIVDETNVRITGIVGWNEVLTAPLAVASWDERVWYQEMFILGGQISISERSWDLKEEVEYGNRLKSLEPAYLMRRWGYPVRSWLHDEIDLSKALSNFKMEYLIRPTEYTSYLKRLFGLALHGIKNLDDLDECENLIKEWREENKPSEDAKEFPRGGFGSFLDRAISKVY